jgi:uncharacterized protein (TIGR03437 family)
MNRNFGRNQINLLASLLVATVIGTPSFAQTIAASGTVNAADYSRAFAPGAIITIFGANLAASTSQAGTLPLPTTMGGATVSLASNGEVLPLFYVSPTQINAQLPYDVGTGPVSLLVTTAAGKSNMDTITVSTQAPKFFTLDASGTGSAVATTPTNSVLTSGNPAKPGDIITLWLNSMGPVSGSPVAGQAAPGATAGSQPYTLATAPVVTVNGLPGIVQFAGLSPGLAGLYQVNIQVPFVGLTGPLVIQVKTGTTTAQSAVTIPFRQMGFYYSLLGGQPVSGQTLNAVAGTTSALALQQNDQLSWGMSGYQAWTNATGLGSSYSSSPGLAITLYNGKTFVYDNNGLDTGTYGTFYNNTGGPSDSLKPGLTDLYSMSNYFPLVFAGYLKLSQPTTITQMVGYFDILGSVTLPFDPANPYVKYRFNVWSMAPGDLPTQTTNFFTGNIFSSDTSAGTFAYTDTGVHIVSSGAGNAPKDIYRLSYTLATPITLPAGEYWLSHDASVRTTPGVTSTSNSVPEREIREYISSQKIENKTYRLNLFGQDMVMTNSWTLPHPVQIRPSAPTEQH